jgi:hypothetical protein
MVSPVPRSALYALPGKWPGMLRPGSIDLRARPVVHNPDGSISTVLSTSFSDNKGREVLVPQVVGGRVVSPQAAWKNYLSTGQHLGMFKTPAAADAYAQALHRQQAHLYGGG